MRGIGVPKPTSCLTTGSTKIEMMGEMAENDEKNGVRVNEKKDDASLGEEKGEKSKNVRMASAVMMIEMQNAENVQMIERKRRMMLRRGERKRVD